MTPVHVRYKPDPGDPLGQIMISNFASKAAAEDFLTRIRRNPDVQSAYIPEELTKARA